MVGGLWGSLAHAHIKVRRKGQAIDEIMYLGNRSTGEVEECRPVLPWKPRRRPLILPRSYLRCLAKTARQITIEPARKPATAGRVYSGSLKRKEFGIPASEVDMTVPFSHPKFNILSIPRSSSRAKSSKLHLLQTSIIHFIRFFPTSPPIPGARSLSFALSSPTFSIALGVLSGKLDSICFLMMLASLGLWPLVEMRI